MGPEDEAERPAWLERGRYLFAQDCRFTHAAATLDQVPPDNLPEVAFAGRSNVGKSSLVNALTGRTTLARISHTPGRTQQLVFFSLADRLGLVDMPGYGYAKVSKSISKAWNTVLRTYLRGRVPLRRVCLLVDSRHGLKPADVEMMTLLDEAAVSYLVVLTKADKPGSEDVQSVLRKTEAALKRHPAALPTVHPTSARDAIGIAELRASLAEAAIPAPG
ncbi:MAG: YihA family ribosome biogenesis GTP-binding protein [Rhodospirillaceae bacterium]|nr:YihA family ribosome biogenesis GTP-binding protein [Rhodospirillaceae bacterium]MCA8934018.1 YihA family ribosome biogenesis GTP-binding protein [Rhodospirillaceae bacterium]